MEAGDWKHVLVDEHVCVGAKCWCDGFMVELSPYGCITIYTATTGDMIVEYSSESNSKGESY
jgi:hypothetical protein